MRLTYAPGEWPVVVRSGTMTVLSPDTGHEVVTAIWDALAQARNLEAALRAVTKAFDGDVTSMPPFAIASLQHRLHVVVRGQITIRGRKGRAETEVSGAHVTTWNEQILHDQDSLDIELDGTVSVEAVLPIEAGAVRAGRVSVELTSGAVASDGSVPATAAVDNEAAERNGAAQSQAAVEGGPHQSAPAASGDQTMSPADLDALDAADEEPAGTDDSDFSHTTGYDHLWDQTVLRRVEDAAIRVDEDGEPVEDEPEPGPAAGPAAGNEPTSGSVPDAVAEDVNVSKSTATAGTGSSDSWQPRSDYAPGAGTGLIDSVPWMKPQSPDDHRTGGSDPAVPSADAGTAAVSREDESHADKPRMGEPQTGTAPADGLYPANEETDHDGRTVMRSELADPPAAASSPASQDAEASRGPSTGPMVLARVCPSGHANPPTNTNCSSCGNQISSEPQEARRPSLGTMRISNGEVVELDRSVIVGRQPSVSRVQGNVMPRMVQVRSDDGDISRSHVEVQLEGWHVMLRDLNSTNGTFLIREGQPPRRLAPGEQTMLLDGDVAELGDDTWLRFEDLK